jgi:hypothetical protein
MGRNLQTMEKPIISLAPWFDTPAGSYVRAWEQARLDELTADIFGYNAVQIGLPCMDSLAANRMPNKWQTDRWRTVFECSCMLYTVPFFSSRSNKMQCKHISKIFRYCWTTFSL